jgi:hypothetical protein
VGGAFAAQSPIQIRPNNFILPPSFRVRIPDNTWVYDVIRLQILERHGGECCSNLCLHWYVALVFGQEAMVYSSSRFGLTYGRWIAYL